MSRGYKQSIRLHISTRDSHQPYFFRAFESLSPLVHSSSLGATCGHFLKGFTPPIIYHSKLTTANLTLMRELLGPSVECMEQIHEEESEHVEQIHKSPLLSGVGTSYKQSAVDLDFELRLASFYLSLFLKSELGYEVNNSEIKSHKKSICICESAGIAASPSEEFPTSVVKKEGTHEVICVAYELVRRRRTVPEKPIDDPRVDLIAYVAGPLDYKPEVHHNIVRNVQFRWRSGIENPHIFVDLYVSNSETILLMRSCAYCTQFGIGAFGIFPVLPNFLIHILMFVWKVQAEKQEVKRPLNFVDFYAYLFRYYLNEEKQKSIDIESISTLFWSSLC
nr:uncharacterized protein LOC109180569 [Ipomoea trifida]